MVCSPKNALLQKEGIPYTICMMFWCITRKMALWTWWHLFIFFFIQVFFTTPELSVFIFHSTANFQPRKFLVLIVLRTFCDKFYFSVLFRTCWNFLLSGANSSGFPAGDVITEKTNKLKPCNSGNPNVFNQGWCCCACCSVKVLN